MRIGLDPTCKRAIIGWRWLAYPSLLAFALCLLTSGASAQDACPQPAGRFASIEGEVDVRSAAGSWRAAMRDEQLCEGDTIRVGRRSRAAVQLINDAVLRIDQNTRLRLMNISGKADEWSWLDLVSGALQSFSRRPWLIKVTTPHLDGDVDGTEFYVQADDDRSLLLVLEGRVLVSNDKGRLAIASGQAATAEAGTPPVYRTVIRPRDSVQWALYYPPLFYLRPDEFPPGPGWKGMVRQAIEFHLKRDLRKAFESIATVPETIRDPRFFAYRASLLLAVGRVVEANADIGRALRLAPNDSNALALQAVIAVAQNEKDKALRVAQRAVGAAPDSATALIALSNAQQPGSVTDFKIPEKAFIVELQHLFRQALEVDVAVADEDERRNVAAQVEQGMQLHRGLGRSEWGPREYRQTQVDGRRIERVDRIPQVDTERFVGIASSRDPNQALRKIAVHTPVARGVRVGQRIAGNVAAETEMIELGALGSQAGLDIAQTLAIGELRERHAQILVQAGEALDLVQATVAIHAAPESTERHVLHELSENEFALVHRLPPRWKTSQVRILHQIVTALPALNVGRAVIQYQRDKKGGTLVETLGGEIGAAFTS